MAWTEKKTKTAANRKKSKEKFYRNKRKLKKNLKTAFEISCKNKRKSWTTYYKNKNNCASIVTIRKWKTIKKSHRKRRVVKKLKRVAEKEEQSRFRKRKFYNNFKKDEIKRHKDINVVVIVIEEPPTSQFNSKVQGSSFSIVFGGFSYVRSSHKETNLMV